MEAQDLGLGCDFCKWPVENGRPDLAFSRWFDRARPAGRRARRGPRQLEFSVTNTCNLQCVMCNGEWSSSIRSQREGLAPLPKVYGDAFFEDLRAFLPHLERVKFLGGEPFLAGETLRIMELMVERRAPRPAATSRPTARSGRPRVERILECSRSTSRVSLDAATAETYEAIRVGSSWDRLQANLDRFRATRPSDGGPTSASPLPDDGRTGTSSPTSA